MTDKKKTKIIATVTYKSGREEKVYGKLNAKEEPNKAFLDKMSAFNAYPLVVSIKKEKM